MGDRRQGYIMREEEFHEWNDPHFLFTWEFLSIQFKSFQFAMKRNFKPIKTFDNRLASEQIIVHKFGIIKIQSKKNADLSCSNEIESTCSRH